MNKSSKKVATNTFLGITSSLAMALLIGLNVNTFHSVSSKKPVVHAQEVSTVTLAPTTDKQEPNDTFADATPFKLGKTVSAYQWRADIETTEGMGDEDYYAVDLEPGTYELQIKNHKATYDFDADYDQVYLYNDKHISINDDGAVNEKESSIARMVENLKTPLEIQTPGKYFLRFHNGAGYKVQPYTFSLTKLK